MNERANECWYLLQKLKTEFTILLEEISPRLSKEDAKTIASGMLENMESIIERAKDESK